MPVITLTHMATTCWSCRSILGPLMQLLSIVFSVVRFSSIQIIGLVLLVSAGCCSKRLKILSKSFQTTTYDTNSPAVPHGDAEDIDRCNSAILLAGHHDQCCYHAIYPRFLLLHWFLSDLVFLASPFDHGVLTLYGADMPP